MSTIDRLRSWKIITLSTGPVAGFDLISTVLGGFLLARWQNWDPLTTVVGTLVLGETAHWMTGVDTPITKLIRQEFDKLQN